MTLTRNRLAPEWNGFATSEIPVNLPALQLSRTPRIARRLSRVLFVFFALVPVLLMFVPWTQTVHGTGRAIAFNPVQRPQFVCSPIEGRIKKWYVVEGQRVKAGQRIVEMVDNDPQLELRLLDEERAILDRLRAAEERVRDIEARIRNLENSRNLAIAVQSSYVRQEEARLHAFRQSWLEAKANYDAALPNYERQRDLERRGLASKRDVELAVAAFETSKAKLEQAEAQIKLGEAAVQAARDNLSKIDADTAAMINLERASLRSAEAEVANIRRDKAQIEVRIARQRAQYVDSPVDGTVFRLVAAGEAGGILVRPGERLAILVPDIPNADAKQMLTGEDYPGIVAELQIDGNDLPLVHKGDRVRLQFEGWPAVQFVGWPSVAVGTFGGRVYLVDPTADDKGYFRILVEPDPDDQPWPDERYLRQGVRTQGWVLLNRVSLGWELWRQLNAFPPVREFETPKKDQPLGPVKLKERK
ncbi:MAG: HlyD family secretion protein [Gemmataceae bacterium]|nr:HlyD family secretion protein [Gemmataceae bacterium]MDW8265905.1 biotin/lipoyl-binding protein [Gemmataceae bacterium]